MMIWRRYGAVALIVLVFVFWLLMSRPLPHHDSDRQRAGDEGPGRRHRNQIESLSTRDGHFYLDNQKVTLLSGAMHYFRVVPQYWRDRMLKMKAAGLNTLETYVAWNIHEREKGKFDFEGMYDLRKYILMAKEVGLMVIVRPGPYICAEWDLGGLPSWLLHDSGMELRSTYPPYLEAVDRYLGQVARQISDLQYSHGGPIIAFQIENEYGSYSDNKKYMASLQQMFFKYNLLELHFTSDNDQGIEHGSLGGVMVMANFKDTSSGKMIFSYLRKVQPGKPHMVMEFWPGWFDHWGEEHNLMPVKEMESVVRFILVEAGHINFYMFHGGTNFGFMNGANYPYAPTITSYDYDAPLSEAGDMTLKWVKVRDMLRSKVKGQIQVPVAPKNGSKFAYGMVQMKSYMTLEAMLSLVKPVESRDVVPMEMLDINNGGGQGHGFILYRKVIPRSQRVQVMGPISDRAQILVDGHEVATLDWQADNPTVTIKNHKGRDKMTLDILVENLGRVNYGHYKGRQLDQQRKGLHREVHADGEKLVGWSIYPLEFKATFMETLLSSALLWKPFKEEVFAGRKSPGIYRGKLTIAGRPKDTFIHFKGWTKGVVFVNSFNLGRYWDIGPQRTLYLPGPLLRTGENEILVFELHKPGSTLSFIERPILG